MTELVPELKSFPVFGIFDGEPVAFDEAGAPDFPLVCERILNRRRHIQLTYIVFDVLRLDGVDLMRAPYSERRAQLEASTSMGHLARKQGGRRVLSIKRSKASQ